MKSTSANFASTPAPPGRGERASANAYCTDASSHIPAFDPRTLTFRSEGSPLSSILANRASQARYPQTSRVVRPPPP